MPGAASVDSCTFPLNVHERYPSMNLMKTMQTWSTTEDAVLNALRQGPLTVSQLIKCGAAFVNAAAALTKRQGSPVKFERGAYRLEGSN